MPVFAPARRTTTIRVRLLAFALAAALPVMLFAAFMLVQSVTDQRSREIDELRRYTTGVASAVNLILYGAMRELSALAVDNDLLEDDMSGAYREAVAFAAQSSIGDAISLVTLDGRTLFHTAYPLNAHLPDYSDMADLAAVVRSRQPRVSNLRLDPLEGRPVVAVSVPVLREGQVNYVIHMDIAPARLQQVLEVQDLRDRWLALLADRDGVVIASSGVSEGAPGPRIGDGLRTAAEAGVAGPYDGRGADGVSVTGAFQRLEPAGWLVALAVPRAQLDAERSRFLLLLGTSAGAMLLVAVWLTLRLARHLEARLLEVAAMARRLGTGLPVEPVVTGIRELDNAGRSLARAAGLIATREADLKRASKVASDALASKAKFFAAANHDLRQPVQSLFLFHAALANMLPADHPAQRPLSHAERSLQALQRLLDGLRDVSRLDAGAVVPMPKELAVDDVLLPLVEEYRLRAADQGITLRHVPCTLRVRSDPALLDRILRNLLENALRYTPRGGRVLLGCRRGSGLARVQVVDTGIGIPADQLGVIFEEFQQLGNPARDSTLGLGLGLAIVRRACDLLGHEIAVASTPERGSTFTVILPQPSAGQVA